MRRSVRPLDATSDAHILAVSGRRRKKSRWRLFRHARVLLDMVSGTMLLSLAACLVQHVWRAARAAKERGNSWFLVVYTVPAQSLGAGDA